ncbi:Protein of unknown function [Rhizobiales bacterium GAS113]|nr:Protein of unknown function [Rhizobiales bacterium GAS113]
MSDDRHERISALAHQIWEGEGRPDGQDRAHWEQAARELDALEKSIPEQPTKPDERAIEAAAPPREKIGKKRPSAGRPTAGRRSNAENATPYAAFSPGK